MDSMHNNRRTVSMAVATLAVLSATGNLRAAELDFGNPDLNVRFDNTVRYNLGFRMQNPDPIVLNSPTQAVGDAQFKKGDIVSNRVDLLTEIDAGYKNVFGLRLSGAAWKDFAWDDQIRVPAGAIGGSFYEGDHWSSKFKHEVYSGGEILDAYLWTKFELGDAATQMKLGKHTAFWGTSLFPYALNAAIAQGQGGVDYNKSALSPGVEAKELFRPQNQLTINSSLNANTSVAFQYVISPSQVMYPPGGSFSGAETGFLFDAPDYYTVVPAVASYGIDTTARHIEDQKPKSGDIGVMVRTMLESLDGPLGLYYRRFSDKAPTLDFVGYNAVASATLTAMTGTPTVIPAGYRLAFDQDNFSQMIGASLEKNFFGMNFGFELSYRSNTGLSTDVAGPDHVGARGNLWNGVANVIATLKPTKVYDGGVFVAEMSYQRLAGVTHNEAQFKGVGYTYCATSFPGQESENRCATKDAVVATILFSPQWQAVLPGVDLSMPIFLAYGLKGNSPSAGALLNEGGANYSIGLEANIRNAYKVKLAYSNSYAKTASTYGTPAATGGVQTNGNGTPWLNDRGMLTLSLQTTF